MGSDMGLSENLDTAMEVLPSSVLDCGNSLRLPKEELGNCASNTVDDTFHAEGSLGSHGRASTSRVNGKDTFLKEGSLCGHDQVIATRVNDEDNFGAESAHGEHDRVTATRVNGDGTRGHDDVMVTKRNGVDSEVDVVGNVVNDMGEGRVIEKDGDETESSSSFGYTDSESGIAEASGDMEVESELRDDNAPLMGFNGCSNLFSSRKKKLTAHWRDYIRPVMWRLKWAELHIRELESQASKYERKLEEYDRRKHCELEKCATEDNAMKLTPFMGQNRSVKVMKRKKRKRVEETTDLASYTSCHSLLSYFARKRSGDGSAYVDDDHDRTGKTPFDSDEFGVVGDLLLLEFKDGDALESILGKIEETQAHVRELRLRMDTVIRETEKFASHRSSSTPRVPLASYGPSSVSPLVNVETVPVGSLSIACWQSTISGDVALLPNPMTTTGPPQVKRTCQKNKVLISNMSIKEEFNNNGDVQTRCIVESQSALAEKATNGSCVSDPGSVREVTASQEQPAVKSRTSSKLATPRNKKKRGRRKARIGRWSKRASG